MESDKTSSWFIFLEPAVACKAKKKLVVKKNKVKADLKTCFISYANIIFSLTIFENANSCASSNERVSTCKPIDKPLLS
jgi:hypothetical protein